MASRAYTAGGEGLRPPPTRLPTGPYGDYKSLRVEDDVDEEPKKKRTGLIIGIIIGVILLLIGIGVLLYFLFFRGSSSGGGGGGGGGGGSTPTNPVGGTCTGSNNCNSGLICSGGFCRVPPGSSCVDQTDCIAGYHCSGGVCLGGQGATCTSDGQCQDPYSCQNNACIQIVCASNTDCRNGTICDTGTQVCLGQQGKTCSNGNQCISVDGNSTFGICSSDTFVCTGGLNGPCVDNSECVTPFSCNTGTCGYIPCTDNAGCALNGGTCYQNFCVQSINDTVDSCTTDAQCDPRAFEDGADRMCQVSLPFTVSNPVNFKKCAVRPGADCTTAAPLGDSVCGTQQSLAFSTACPMSGVCNCFVGNNQCIASAPVCDAVLLFGDCTTAPSEFTEEDKEKANKEMAYQIALKKNIGKNMMTGKKPKDKGRKKLGKFYRKDTDDVKIGTIRDENTIRSVGVANMYNEMIDRMHLRDQEEI